MQPVNHAKCMLTSTPAATLRKKGYIYKVFENEKSPKIETLHLQWNLTESAFKPRIVFYFLP